MGGGGSCVPTYTSLLQCVCVCGGGGEEGGPIYTTVGWGFLCPIFTTAGRGGGGRDTMVGRGFLCPTFKRGGGGEFGVPIYTTVGGGGGGSVSPLSLLQGGGLHGGGGGGSVSHFHYCRGRGGVYVPLSLLSNLYHCRRVCSVSHFHYSRGGGSYAPTVEWRFLRSHLHYCGGQGEGGGHIVTYTTAGGEDKRVGWRVYNWTQGLSPWTAKYTLPAEWLDAVSHHHCQNTRV